MARELDIKPQLLYKWRREYDALGEGSFSGNGSLKLTPEQEKIHELEKKLRDIELEHTILKKSHYHFLQDRSMKYTFIKNNEGLFSIDKMCKVLEVGLSSYY